jgi:hypothetical protein
MRKEAQHRSKRFKNPEDLKKYFKDAEISPLIDAILFLASEIEDVRYELNCLDNEYRGYDP